MVESARGFAVFVLVTGVIVLGTALLSQYWGGLAPCELCLLQRWPWAIAVAISLGVVFVGSRVALRWVALALAVVFAAGALFAFYHVGVEQHWFAGPAACTASGGGAMTLDEMKRQILGTAPVLCDKVQWSFFGISLAGWNLLASLVMAAICAAACKGTRPAAAGRLAA
jgi:disulfide bond formation protein DsbB